MFGIKRNNTLVEGLGNFEWIFMGIILDKDFCPYIFVAKPPPINEKISMEYVMNLNKEKN